MIKSTDDKICTMCTNRLGLWKTKDSRQFGVPQPSKLMACPRNITKNKFSVFERFKTCPYYCLFRLFCEEKGRADNSKPILMKNVRVNVRDSRERAFWVQFAAALWAIFNWDTAPIYYYLFIKGKENRDPCLQVTRIRTISNLSIKCCQETTGMLKDQRKFQGKCETSR